MARRLPAKEVGAALDTLLRGAGDNPEQLETLLANRDIDQIRYLRRVLHFATMPADTRPDDRYDADTPDPITIWAWRANKQPATPRDLLGPPPPGQAPAIPIQKSPPVRGTCTSSASSSATATPVYTATPVARVQAKVPPAKAAPPPLVEETPPPEAP